MKGLGSDILSIDRIKAVINRKERFILSIFTKKEILYCQKYKDPFARFAGRFCAKEAIAKALGLGIGKTISWKDIEVLNDTNGKPKVFFSKKINVQFNYPKIFLSISHDKNIAFAIAIWKSS